MGTEQSHGPVAVQICPLYRPAGWEQMDDDAVMDWMLIQGLQPEIHEAAARARAEAENNTLVECKAYRVEGGGVILNKKIALSDGGEEMRSDLIEPYRQRKNLFKIKTQVGKPQDPAKGGKYFTTPEDVRNCSEAEQVHVCHLFPASEEGDTFTMQVVVLFPTWKPKGIKFPAWRPILKAAWVETYAKWRELMKKAPVPVNTDRGLLYTIPSCDVDTAKKIFVDPRIFGDDWGLRDGQVVD